MLEEHFESRRDFLSGRIESIKEFYKYRNY